MQYSIEKYFQKYVRRKTHPITRRPWLRALNEARQPMARTSHSGKLSECLQACSNEAFPLTGASQFTIDFITIFAVLVEDRRPRANNTVTRTAGRTANIEDLRLGAQFVVRVHGIGPAQLFDASSDHSTLTLIDSTRRRITIAAVSHPDAQRPLKKEFLPAPSSMWNGWGSYMLAKAYDLLCSYAISSLRIEFLTRIEVLEVHLLLHSPPS